MCSLISSHMFCEVFLCCSQSSHVSLVYIPFCCPICFAKCSSCCSHNFHVYPQMFAFMLSHSFSTCYCELQKQDSLIFSSLTPTKNNCWTTPNRAKKNWFEVGSRWAAWQKSKLDVCQGLIIVVAIIELVVGHCLSLILEVTMQRKNTVRVTIR
jgi:hypothetical protein